MVLVILSNRLAESDAMMLDSVFCGSHKDISFADAFVVEETQIAGIATIHLVFGMGDGTMYGFLFIRISLHDPRTDVFREWN